MSDTDPILRALQEGDTACPDGAALARLGSMVRDAAKPPQKVDLNSRILQACADMRAAGTDEEDGHDEAAWEAAIDAAYDGEDSDDFEELTKLRNLIRDAAEPPEAVDLLPRLEGRFDDRGASRRFAASQVDRHTRWRIWTAVIGGHVAAILALAIFNVQIAHMNPEGGNGQGLVQVDGGEPGDRSTLPDQYVDEHGQPIPLPTTWAKMGGRPKALMSLRADAGQRQRAAIYFRLDESEDTVKAAVNWLIAQQDDSGQIGTTSGRADRDIAIQSLTALALAGEAAGAEDHSLAVRRALRQNIDWLLQRCGQAQQWDHDALTMALWALVDAAIVLDDRDLRVAAEKIFAGLGVDSLTALGPRHQAQLYLAVSLAQVAGFTLPTELMQSTARYASALPNAVRDDANGLYVYFIQKGIRGQRERVTALAGDLPHTMDGAVIDPLAWLPATMAVRELGGTLWWDWAGALQDEVLGRFHHSDGGLAWLPAAHVRHADKLDAAGDVFATALGLLNLQVAYRYLPLSH